MQNIMQQKAKKTELQLNTIKQAKTKLTRCPAKYRFRIEESGITLLSLIMPISHISRAFLAKNILGSLYILRYIENSESFMSNLKQMTHPL